MPEPERRLVQGDHMPGGQLKALQCRLLGRAAQASVAQHDEPVEVAAGKRGNVPAPAIHQPLGCSCRSYAELAGRPV